VRNAIKNVCFMLRSLSDISKTRIVISGCSLVCNIIEMMIFNVIFFPFIIYAITSEYEISRYLFVGCSLIALLIVAVVFRLWRDYLYIPRSNLEISSCFQRIVMEKSKNIDLIDFNSSKWYDRYLWVTREIDHRPIDTLNSCFSCLQSLVMIVVVSFIMVSLEPVMLAFVVVPIAVNLLTSTYMNKIQYQYSKEKLASEKRISYISRVFYLPDYAQEIKISHIRNVFFKKFSCEIIFLKSLIQKMGTKLGALGFTEHALTDLCSTSLAILYLAYLALIKRSLNVSNIVVLSNSIWQLSAHFLSLFSIIPQMQKHSKYIQDYRDFIAYEPKIKENPAGKEAKKAANSIEISGLYFRYSEREDYVLKNINMHINAGERIAIVGHNGAGKSTLINLIMRLYLPSAGRIQMDGIDIDDYNLTSYRERFGTVFQNFQIYAASLEENITMDLCEDKVGTEEKVVNSLKASGLWERVAREKEGVHAEMTKEFLDEGITLSGGEAQKLALSRVFYKESGVIILDEPSSALDPISEYEMNRNMMVASKDKTVIMISHRLSTTKDADRIYYFENGEIKEQGTHQELMNLNKRYAAMFHLQADAYQEAIK
jgi:ATP-binding cassette subfamily B protein